MLSHLDKKGRIRMVDITEKSQTMRVAQAECTIFLGAKLVKKIMKLELSKGDLFNTARLSGIMAAKNVSSIIPLSHNINISWADVEIIPKTDRLKIITTVKAGYSTGVELEALYAAMVSGLTVYDMVKSEKKDAVIENVRLIYKTGGKSGVFLKSD